MGAVRRLLFVADGRSPIALNWMQYFVEQGYSVHLASTFPCSPALPLDSLSKIPVAFSGVKTTPEAGNSHPGLVKGRDRLLRQIAPVRLRTALRQWLGILTLSKAARTLRNLVDKLQPDLVHAMRIPFEGMLVAAARPEQPIIISTWGNDFTLHAPANPWMGRWTRRTLIAADGLHTDCRRDVGLAREWGFPAGRPVVVLPGGGGVRTDIFSPPVQPLLEPCVLNPRGIRAYVRNDTFFTAIPRILQKIPSARFLCVGMAGERAALQWLEQYHIADSVELLPQQTQSQMAELYRRSPVMVSPSTHDGTPNSLLEAMACGCFPVVGDLESIREWITPGDNGLLVDPTDPHELAEAVLWALSDNLLRNRARRLNSSLITEHAEHGRVMQQAEQFYKKWLG